MAGALEGESWQVPSAPFDPPSDLGGFDMRHGLGELNVWSAFREGNWRWTHGVKTPKKRPMEASPFSTNGKLVVWGPEVWDSNRSTPK